jgi:hypothetical protein
MLQDAGSISGAVLISICVGLVEAHRRILRLSSAGSVLTRFGLHCDAVLLSKTLSAEILSCFHSRLSHLLLIWSIFLVGM